MLLDGPFKIRTLDFQESGGLKGYGGARPLFFPQEGHFAQQVSPAAQRGEDSLLAVLGVNDLNFALNEQMKSLPDLSLLEKSFSRLQMNFVDEGKDQSPFFLAEVGQKWNFAKQRCPRGIECH